MLPKIILIGLLTLTLIVGFALYGFWNRKIDPRSSFRNYVTWTLVNCLSVFILVFLFAWVIFSFRGFFFK